MKRLCLILLLAATALAHANGAPDSPLLEAARREGQLVVHATTDRDQVTPLLKAFARRYPFLAVQYHDLSSTELYRRALGKPGTTGDVLWSSAMDLQIKLVNDGYALAYRSPQKAALPDWASWRDEVYGTTFEPVVLAYNRHTISDHDMPDSHAALRRQLHARGSSWRVAAYNVETSGTGYLFLSQDSRHNPEFWDLAATLARQVRYQEDSSQMLLQRLARGEADIAYNVLGPYAWRLARQYPQIDWVLPEDYTLVVTRLQLIHRAARHPAAAKLWMNFVLSREGQQVLSQASGVPPIREDLPRWLGRVNLANSAERLRPIQVGSGLLVYLDSAKKSLFLKRWRELQSRASQP